MDVLCTTFQASHTRDFTPVSVDADDALCDAPEQALATVESGIECHALRRFLDILIFLTQDQSGVFRPFLPSILTLGMDSLYPVLADHPSADVRSGLFLLIRSLLLDNWRSFFPAALGEEAVEHGAHVILMFRAVLRAFTQPDINHFRTNLETVSLLNTQKKLFHKAVFRSVLLPEYLDVLVRVLCAKSHDLLSDEIRAVVYDLAAVDFQTFFAGFLPGFLKAVEGVAEEAKQELAGRFTLDTDVPTFMRNLADFAGDIYYHQQRPAPW